MDGGPRGGPRPGEFRDAVHVAQDGEGICEEPLPADAEAHRPCEPARGVTLGARRKMHRAAALGDGVQAEAGTSLHLDAALGHVEPPLLLSEKRLLAGVVAGLAGAAADGDAAVGESLGRRRGSDALSNARHDRPLGLAAVDDLQTRDIPRAQLPAVLTAVRAQVHDGAAVQRREDIAATLADIADGSQPTGRETALEVLPGVLVQEPEGVSELVDGDVAGAITAADLTQETAIEPAGIEAQAHLGRPHRMGLHLRDVHTDVARVGPAVGADDEDHGPIGHVGGFRGFAAAPAGEAEIAVPGPRELDLLAYAQRVGALRVDIVRPADRHDPIRPEVHVLLNEQGRGVPRRGETEGPTGENEPRFLHSAAHGAMGVPPKCLRARDGSDLTQRELASRPCVRAAAQPDSASLPETARVTRCDTRALSAALGPLNASVHGRRRRRVRLVPCEPPSSTTG